MTKERAPALYLHCVEIYNMLKETSVEAEVEGQTVLVWTGFLTKIFVKANMSTPMYTTVRRRLMEMDCIRQLRRGGGGAPSEWILIQDPTEELWDSVHARGDITKSQATPIKGNESTWQALRDLNRRVLILEQALGFQSNNKEEEHA